MPFRVFRVGQRGDRTMRILNTMDKMADCFVDGRCLMPAWQKYIGEYSPPAGGEVQAGRYRI